MPTEMQLREHLRGLIADAMYLGSGEPHDDEPFDEIGLESVTLVKVLAKICALHALVIDDGGAALRCRTLRELSASLHGAIQSAR